MLINKSESNIFFVNKFKALEFLKQEGYKIGRQTFYNHVNEGKLVLENDGRINKVSLINYANSYLKRNNQSNKHEKINMIRIASEARIAKAKAKIIEIDLKLKEGNVINKNQVDNELAFKAALLKSDVNNLVKGKVMKIIDLVKGDHLYEQELVKFLMNEFDLMFDRYSKPIEFDIEIK